MRRTARLLVVLMGLTLIGAPAFGSTAGLTPIATSLFLNDWGVSYGDWDPVYFHGGHVGYDLEDWVGEGNGWLGPGYGGQAFDVEAVYFGMDEESYYFAVVTGFGPEGGQGYLPGDLFVDFGDNGDWDFALDVDGGGTLMTGITSWQNTALDYRVADPFRVTEFSGAPMPVTGFRYGDFSGRYAIEAILDRDLVQNAPGRYRVHWTMGCGNDVGELVGALPEPTTLLLLGGGLFGLAAGRLRRKR